MPGIISVTLGKMHGKEPGISTDEHGDTGTSDDDDEAFATAADEAFEAAKSGDKDKFRDALENAISICFMRWSDEGDEDTGEHDRPGEETGRGGY